MREFQEKLEQLMELAAKQEQNLNNEQILEIFGLNQLSPQQLQSLYEYLQPSISACIHNPLTASYADNCFLFSQLLLKTYYR